jgi:hypothetical protein
MWPHLTLFYTQCGWTAIHCLFGVLYSTLLHFTVLKCPFGEGCWDKPRAVATFAKANYTSGVSVRLRNHQIFHNSTLKVAKSLGLFKENLSMHAMLFSLTTFFANFYCYIQNITVHTVLKVTKREIFVTELIILSHPIWIGDLRIKAKNRFVRIVRLLFAILVFFR